MNIFATPLLYQQNGIWVLHLHGTPYEMGFQHGQLLKDKIHANISNYIENESNAIERALSFQPYIPRLLKHIPQKYIEEMHGIADGAGIPFKKIVLLNLFPEMFHCSGVIVSQNATKDGSLYHVRILDYNVGKHLQKSAILMIVEPDKAIPFLNVSYAGFIGTVTGMNQQKIAIGEIGGKGYGHWDGMPMSFLLRMILENAHSLEEAKEILSSTKRTCEYFYLISDGKSNDSFAVLATHDHLQMIMPGEEYSLEDLEKTVHLHFENPPHSLALTGFSNPERHEVLKERLMQHLGLLDEILLQKIIQAPVAKEDNLHTAIFHPSSLRVWIAHAGPNDEPAYSQTYHCFSLEEELRVCL